MNTRLNLLAIASIGVACVVVGMLLGMRMVSGGRSSPSSLPLPLTAKSLQDLSWTRTRMILDGGVIEVLSRNVEKCVNQGSFVEVHFATPEGSDVVQVKPQGREESTIALIDESGKVIYFYQ